MRDAARLAEAGRLLAPLGVGEPSLDEHRRAVVVPTAGGAAVLTDALRRLDAASVEIDDVGLRRPTLDDVFLTLTGRPAEDVPETDDDGAHVREPAAAGTEARR